MTKEEQIMAIAEEEFIQNGYLSTSMVTVAKKAGVTHAMVNYYYRSKEQLFLRILDKHVMQFVNSLGGSMREDEDFLRNIVNASDALFNALDSDRQFPFMIQDVIRTCPDLLDKYKDMLTLSVRDMIAHHSKRLEAEIEAGRMPSTSMADILGNIFSMAVTPFLTIPALENLCGHSEEMIEDYLERRKAEAERIILSRYSI